MKYIAPFLLLLILHSGCKKELDPSLTKNEKGEIVPKIVLGTSSLIRYYSVTSNSFICEGKITFDGGGKQIKTGFVWSTKSNPLLSDSKTEAISKERIFSSAIEKLSPNTYYYIKPFFTNEAGTTLGGEIIIKTTSIPPTTYSTAVFPALTFETIQDIDGNSYKTIKIGTQTWMAENLKTTKFSDGTSIPSTSDPLTDISNESAPIYQWSYNNNKELSKNAGLLYTWYAASSLKGVCPTNWHVPREDEWLKMTSYLGGLDNVGYKLKELGSTHWSIANKEVTNETGFTALPAGYRNSNGTFDLINITGYWWTSTQTGAENANHRNLNIYNSGLGNYGLFKKSGASIRCIKD